jgi:hypothetical protein
MFCLTYNFFLQFFEISKVSNDATKSLSTQCTNFVFFLFLVFWGEICAKRLICESKN